MATSIRGCLIDMEIKLRKTDYNAGVNGLKFRVEQCFPYPYPVFDVPLMRILWALVSAHIRSFMRSWIIREK